jgi:hypothetical protein
MEDIDMRDGWDYDDLDEDYYEDDQFSCRCSDSGSIDMVSERECKSIQKRQKEKN